MLGRKCQERRATGGWPEPWERPGATLEQEDRGASDPEDVWGGGTRPRDPPAAATREMGACTPTTAWPGTPCLDPWGRWPRDPSFAENKASPGEGMSQAAPRA